MVFIALSDKNEATLNNRTDQENYGRDAKVPARLLKLLDQQIVSKM